MLLLPALPLVVLVAHQAPLPADGIRLLEWNAQDHPGAVTVLEGLTAQSMPDVVVVSQVEQSALETSTELGPALSATGPTPRTRGPPTTSRSCRRYPIAAEHTDVRPVPGPGPGLRALVVDVSVPGGTVRLVTAHPTRPLLEPGQSYGAWRDPQLALLAEVVRSLDVPGGPPLLVVGDFNVTTREAA